VQDDVMAFTDEGTGGGAAESVGGAGDEDTGHGMILPLVVCRYRSRILATAHVSAVRRLLWCSGRKAICAV
jgi:hypothetical protein